MTTNIQLSGYCKKLGVKLNEIRNKDDLPYLKNRKDGLYIINSENFMEGNGIHWVAYYVDGKEACYMDSFAGFPYRQIKEFSKGLRLVFNKTQLQHIDSKRCGEFSVWFGYCMYKKYRKVQGLHNRLKLFLKEFETDDRELLKNDNILKKNFLLFKINI